MLEEKGFEVIDLSRGGREGTHNSRPHLTGYLS
jgi:hypothetical protein